MLDDAGAKRHPDLAGNVFTARDIPVIRSHSRKAALVQAGFEVVDELPAAAQEGRLSARIDANSYNI